MPDGGRLTILTRVESGLVEIQFTDTGIGIREENLEHIFEPLFTAKANGVGLGLSIVKDFVEKHNGTIEVASEPGRGTTLTVRLPIEKEQPG